MKRDWCCSEMPPAATALSPPSSGWAGWGQTWHKSPRTGNFL